MSGNERRQEISRLLAGADHAVSGKELAERFAVSRQVIVQDIALLRANGEQIVSTNLGYLMPVKSQVSRVFKVYHTDEQMEEELALVVDHGGTVQDVFVYHKTYGVIRADLNIRSRLDIRRFSDDIRTGKSTPLKNITSGYHYHTVIAPSEEILDLIQQELEEHHFLAQLLDYEPVDFWKDV
ncbi:MAG: transcription repressor NadR [Lachnospiraceae bacterium]|nr:transcription repressor NadR [Lachnospiraceae bacterium]